MERAKQAAAAAAAAAGRRRGGGGSERVSGARRGEEQRPVNRGYVQSSRVLNITPKVIR